MEIRFSFNKDFIEVSAIFRHYGAKQYPTPLIVLMYSLSLGDNPSLFRTEQIRSVTLFVP